MRARVLVVDDSETVRQTVREVLVAEHFAVDTARSASDGLAVAQRHRPDVCLIDLALRGMGGIGLCQALAQDAVLRDTHIVLLATKNDPVLDELRPLIGDAALLEKPFSPDALKAAIAAQLRAPNATHAAREASVELQTWIDRIVRSPPEGRQGVLEQCLTLLGADRHSVLSGNLAVVPLAELFQMLTLQAQTGRLRVSGPGLAVDVYLSEGRVDFVHAERTPPELLLGRVLVSEGLLGAPDLERFLRYRRKNRLLGQQLILLGYLTTEEMRQGLAVQSSELVYSVLRLRSGRFALYPLNETPPLAMEYRLSLATEALLMEGYRRVDELSLIEAALGPETGILRADSSALERFGHQNLTADEQALLALVDGKTPLVRIVERAPYGRFMALKALYRLREARIVLPSD